MIAVLRWGHRIPRDSRMTTHVALTARAFGADIIYVDTEDIELENTVRSVVKRFGGDFEIQTGVNWKRIVREWKGAKVHLTMYGEHIDNTLPKIPKDDVLIMVGAEKVPRDFYEMADFNVAVGNQPHSEVAALAVFLDRFLEGKGLRNRFENAEMEVIPNPRGKTVREHDSG
jgi:tRNA (cytidine56-2'-O)-methyltransferase